MDNVSYYNICVVLYGILFAGALYNSSQRFSNADTMRFDTSSKNWCARAACKPVANSNSTRKSTLHMGLPPAALGELGPGVKVHTVRRCLNREVSRDSA